MREIMAQEIEKSNALGVPSTDVINLGSNSLIDLTGMPPEQIAELKRQYASGMIDLKKKAEEVKIDNASLAMTLDSYNTEAAKATQANVSITATHTQTTAIGRSEVVIGNTDRAASGKLSASAAGVPDRLLWIVGIAAVAAVIVALIIFHH
jgi:hypothetical protein